MADACRELLILRRIWRKPLGVDQYMAPMPNFRLLFLDADGRPTHSCDFHASDEAEAVCIAEDRRTLCAMQLWIGERKLRQWETFPPSM